MKEEVNYDPTKTESINVELHINDKKNSNGRPLYAIHGTMPWIIGDVEDKIQTVMGMENLASIFIYDFKCKSWVANEFLDMLCSYDIPEQGLEKLTFKCFIEDCKPFEDEVVTRLASICPHLS